MAAWIHYLCVFLSYNGGGGGLNYKRKMAFWSISVAACSGLKLSQLVAALWTFSFFFFLRMPLLNERWNSEVQRVCKSLALMVTKKPSPHALSPLWLMKETSQKGLAQHRRASEPTKAEPRSSIPTETSRAPPLSQVQGQHLSDSPPTQNEAWVAQLGILALLKSANFEEPSGTYINIIFTPALWEASHTVSQVVRDWCEREAWKSTTDFPTPSLWTIRIIMCY